MSYRPSVNLANLTSSQTVAISTEARRRKAAGEDIIDLGGGEPDFRTPEPAGEAGIAAIREGKTHYAPNVGIAPLREAMAGALSRMSGGRAVDPARLIVSNGSKQALFNACFSLFGPGDKVLIPSPAWVSYPQIVHLCRAEPVSVVGDPSRGMKVSVEELERHRDDSVKGLILCTPCNPTGAVYSAAEIQTISSWCREHGVWLICDEIYRRIHYGNGPAPSLLDLGDEALEMSVVIYGASKAYAMTGWRIGAAYAPVELLRSMAALQSHTTTGANQPAMWAAATAFADPEVDKAVDQMVAAFRGRRDYLLKRLREEAPQVGFVEPEGAFYLFFRVDGLGAGDDMCGMKFCERAMAESGLAMVPGEAFGDERWVRLSYSLGDAELASALDRLIPFFAGLSGTR